MAKKPRQGPVDSEVVAAIREAVKEAQQPDKVSRRLEAWLADLSLGRTDLASRGEFRKHFDAVTKAMDVSPEEEDAQ